MNNRNLSVFNFITWTLTAWCCFLVSAANAATVNDTSSTGFADSLFRSYSAENNLFLESLDTVTSDKKLLRYYRDNYKKIFKILEEDIRDGQIVDRRSVMAVLENALHNIRQGNPDAPENIRIMLLRNDVPNAFTIGDKAMFVNIGLFYYLESEDEVAGVIAHELAHLMCKHTLRALQGNYERDKESATEIRDLQQANTNRSERAFEMLKNTIYKGGERSREHELQADSLGYLLLKNTPYRKHAFTDALRIITQHDTLRHDGVRTAIYRRLFDLPGQPFRDQWLKVEDFSSYNYSFKEKLNKDSVVSHPKGWERVQHLYRIFPELSQPSPSVPPKDSGLFGNARRLAMNERIPDLFFNERYGEVVYSALLHLQDAPDDAKGKEWLGKGFRQIYEARRDYRLNKYLDRVAPREQTESYIQFLSFMWNLKLEELKNIAAYYAVQVNN